MDNCVVRRTQQVCSTTQHSETLARTRDEGPHRGLMKIQVFLHVTPCRLVTDVSKTRGASIFWAKLTRHADPSCADTTYPPRRLHSSEMKFSGHRKVQSGVSYS